MRLSVVIPFYNLERYVRPCLDSVVAAAKAAGGAELEVLCVNDGSTDGTAARLDAYTPAFDLRSLAFNLRVIHKSNGGEGSARNAGMAAATGDWITFLDGDDLWLGNHLTVAVPLLESHADADIVALKYASFDDGASPPPPSSSSAKVFDTTRELNSEVMIGVGVFPTFFRRGFLEGSSFSALPLGADRLFVAQCLARARAVVKCDAVVHGYRVRAGSMARAVWNARKVASQCDYAFGSLQALVESGKRLGREGHAYLASLWLSDVPNRLLRLSASERRASAEAWRKTLGSGTVAAALGRVDGIRRILRAVGGVSPSFALRLAWVFRKGGLI